MYLKICIFHHSYSLRQLRSQLLSSVARLVGRQQFRRLGSSGSTHWSAQFNADDQLLACYCIVYLLNQTVSLFKMILLTVFQLTMVFEVSHLFEKCFMLHKIRP
jgi:hypothetical protein